MFPCAREFSILRHLPTQYADSDPYGNESASSSLSSGALGLEISSFATASIYFSPQASTDKILEADPLDVS